MLTFLCASAQDNAAYLKAHAVRVDNPEQLSDSVYHLLAPFQMIMFGEIHGTNESTPFVMGLANLFTANGDSVQVGLEIPPNLITQFISQRTDSSIYHSDFFHNPPLDGKESVAWATLISELNKNSRVELFFFDVNSNEGKPYQRDSLMYVKIKTQFKRHPTWKMVTLSGNFHNRISDEATMASYLNRDEQLNLSSKICSLTIQYLSGTCTANFGRGLEVKQLGHPETVYDSSFDKYLVLFPPNSEYPYTGFYYTRFITAAKMTNSK
ncbi:MAG TPA: hypothetical protein VE978_11330 [Chitinophagales bacterium]|nr:hypothetical protein [Chitinophagales bacterium]